MESHNKVARAHRALSWLYGLLFVLTMALMASPDGGLSWETILFTVLFLGGLFALHHDTAKGAMLRKRWARNTSRGIAVLMLLGMRCGLSWRSGVSART